MTDDLKIDRLKKIIALQNLLIAKLRVKANFYEADEIEVAILNLSMVEWWTNAPQTPFS